MTAGGFQPRALAALRAWEGTRLALVVGKAYLFRGRDGVAHSSIRAEAVRAISEDDYRAALVDAVAQTQSRLEVVESLQRAPAVTPTPEEVPPGWVEAARSALRRYPTLDRAVFERGLSVALDVVAGAPVPAPAPDVPIAPVARDPPRARVTRTPPASPRPAPTAQERAVEASFLDILDDLAESSVDGYADLKEALERAAARGLSETRAEELLNRLEESGVLEEPVVGKLRRA